MFLISSSFNCNNIPTPTISPCKNFFGVIHPDNKTITWVATNSRGYNMGKLLGKNKISACYVESGIDATAGCAELTRK